MLVKIVLFPFWVVKKLLVIALGIVALGPKMIFGGIKVVLRHPLGAVLAVVGLIMGKNYLKDKQG